MFRLDGANSPLSYVLVSVDADVAAFKYIVCELEPFVVNVTIFQSLFGSVAVHVKVACGIDITGAVPPEETIGDVPVTEVTWLILLLPKHAMKQCKTAH